MGKYSSLSLYQQTLDAKWTHAIQVIRPHAREKWVGAVSFTGVTFEPTIASLLTPQFPSRILLRWCASRFAPIAAASLPFLVRGLVAGLHPQPLGGRILACIVVLALQFGNRIQILMRSTFSLELQARIQPPNHGFCVIRSSHQVGIQARGFRQVPRMSGEAATELSAGVALPPPDDEFVSGSGNEVPEQVGEAGAALSGRHDSYEGVIVDPRSLPSDSSTFKQSLMASIAQWRRERKRGIWLKLPIESVNLVEAAVAAGFRYHHAEPTYLMLTLWLPDVPCTLPPNASHQVGVGAFVLNDKNERKFYFPMISDDGKYILIVVVRLSDELNDLILAVQEKTGPLKGTGVWKMPTGLTNQGEDIFDAAIREVKEETGVDARFLEVVGFRQGHQVAFEKSDLFFLCILRPTSTEIVPQESEIAAAKWMPISEFKAQPIFNQRPTMHKMLEVCLARAEGRCRGFAYDPIYPDSLNPSSYFYYNQVDLLGEQGQTKL